MYLENDSLARLIFLFSYAALASYFVNRTLKLNRNFFLSFTVSLTLLIQLYLNKTIFSLWTVIAVISTIILLRSKDKSVQISIFLILLLTAFFNAKILVLPRTIFNEVGIINTVNQLRGEESYSFLSKLLYNKSLFLYYYLGNLLKGLDFTNLSANLLFANVIFLIVGIYKYFKSFSKEKILIFIWLVVGILPVGILKAEYKEPFIFLIPAILYLVLLGIGKNKTIVLIYLLILLLSLSTSFFMSI